MANENRPAQPARMHTVYVVAAGISTVGHMGILAEGKEVTPEDIEGGNKAFDELVRRGVLVKVSKAEEKKADGSEG